MNALATSFAVLSLAVCFGSSATFADSGATSRPADDEPVMGDVRVQTLKGYTYAFVSTRTTLRKLLEAIDSLMPAIDSAINAGQLRPEGPMVFAYHGATGDPDQEFTLDIGIAVKGGGKPVAGIEVIQIPARKCATLLYTGSALQLPNAYGKLFGGIGQMGLKATDVCREVYLYWEDRGSVNNIVLLEADLAP
jgi:effector-binding domain-containing protein